MGSHAWWIRSRSRRMAKVLGRGGLVDRRAAACVSRRPYLVARSGRSRAVASSSRRTALRPIEAVPMTCPVCSEVLDFEVKSEGGPVVGPPEKIACSSCKYEATNTSSFFDLTILPSEAIDPSSQLGPSVLDAFSELAQGQAKSGEASKASSSSYKEKLWSVSQLFQSPVISYVYERGWRQGFDWAGFPGADKEFEILQKLFETSETRPLSQLQSPSSVLDVSCGTGLFSR